MLVTRKRLHSVRVIMLTPFVRVRWARYAGAQGQKRARYCLRVSFGSVVRCPGGRAVAYALCVVFVYTCRVRLRLVGVG